MDHPCPKDIVANIHQIGSLPQSLSAVLKTINNPDVDADSIAEVISKDVALTSRVLRMVNSAQYSRHRKVSKVSEAVVVMGLNSIKMLALSSSVFGIIPNSESFKGFDIRRIWRHLIEVGSNARNLAEKSGYPDREEAFVAGILHDFGIPIMILHFKEKYLALIEKMKNEKIGILAAEKEVFGFTHCEVGAEAANAWRLPSRLIHVIQNHHSIEAPAVMPEDATLNTIIGLSDKLTIGPFDDYFDVKTNIEQIRMACEKLDLSPDVTNQLRKDAIKQAIKLAEYLELDVGDIIEILTEANEKIAEIYFSLEELYLRNSPSGSKTTTDRQEKAPVPA